MLSKLPRFIAFFFACVMVLRDWAGILAKNVINTEEYVEYVLPDSVEIGAIALGVVGLSIFLKRNIWAYLFFLVVIASFFPVLSFNNYSWTIYIGSLKLDMIAILLLGTHVLLNIHLVKVPELSPKQVEESNTEKVQFFVKRLEKKSDEELLQMDEADLVPEAIKARKNVLEKRSL